MYQADILGLSALLPIKTAWKDATLEASMTCFPSEALIKFAFTQLLLCKEMILVGEAQWFRWSRAFMRLPGIVACSKLDISGLSFSGTYEIRSADVVEWLEYEAPPETECSEPRQLSLKDDYIRGIDGLLIALKTVSRMWFTGTCVGHRLLFIPVGRSKDEDWPGCSQESRVFCMQIALPFPYTAL